MTQPLQPVPSGAGSVGASGAPDPSEGFGPGEPVNPPTKPIWQSKTLWYNLLVTIVAGIAYVQQTSSGFAFTPNEVALLGLAYFLGNTIMRIWFTSEPLTQFAARRAGTALKALAFALVLAAAARPAGSYWE